MLHLGIWGRLGQPTQDNFIRWLNYAHERSGYCKTISKMLEDSWQTKGIRNEQLRFMFRPSGVSGCIPVRLAVTSSEHYASRLFVLFRVLTRLLNNVPSVALIQAELRNQV